MVYVSGLLNQLKSNGYRMTKTRKNITDIFSSSETPVSANYILELLDNSINKTTVYRELDFLESQGIITSLPLSLEEKYYELNQDHHHHLICEKCRNIQRYDNCLVDNVVEDIQKSRGFLVHKHSMEFYGLCNNCH